MCCKNIQHTVSYSSLYICFLLFYGVALLGREESDNKMLKEYQHRRVGALYRVSCAIIALLLCTLPQVSKSAAWLQDDGSWQVLQTATYYKTDSYYDPAGVRQPSGRFQKKEVDLYAEWGAADDWTIGVQASLSQSEHYHSPGSGELVESGLSNVAFFSRHPLWQKGEDIISFQPWVKFPVQSSQDIAAGNPEKAWEAELRLLYGHCFCDDDIASPDHFSNLEVAYRKRYGDATDQLRIDATFGFRPQDDILLMPQLFATISTNDVFRAGGNLVNPYDYNSAKLQFSVVKDVDRHWSMQFGGYRYVWSENTGGGGGVLFSFWYRY